MTTLNLGAHLCAALEKPFHWALHHLPLDLLDEWARVAFFSKGPYFELFPKGWGASYPQLQRLFSIHPKTPIPRVKISWINEKTLQCILYREGSFRVRQSQGLPAEIRDAQFRFIPPPDGKKEVCLLLAGWGEHGYVLRMRLAKLLWKKGIGTLLLENPFHGHRLVPGRRGAPVWTVAEAGHLVHAAVYEGRALVKHFEDLGYQLGVAGFSMGGSLAAWIAVKHPHPLPTTLLATPPSPEVGFLGGVIRKGIAWQQLSQLKYPEEKLRNLLGRVSLLNVAPPLPGKRIIMMGARADRVVPAATIVDLHRYWPHSQLRWCPGGHISLWLFEVKAMVQAIEDSFLG